MSAAQGQVTVLEPKAGNIIAADAATVMGAITRLSSDSAVDVDKLERLLAAYNTLRANEQRVAYQAAFAAAKREIGPVVRDKANEQTKSKYASLEAIAAVVDEKIAIHGLTLMFSQDISPIEGCYRIVGRVKHDAGYIDPPEDKPPYFVDVPADVGGLRGNTNKTATHAFGSTMTYGRRYLKTLIFDIAVKDHDDDGNAASRKVATVDDLETLYACIKELNADFERRGMELYVDTEKLLRRHNFANFAAIPPKEIPKLIVLLKQWAATEIRRHQAARR